MIMVLLPFIILMLLVIATNVAFFDGLGFVTSKKSANLINCNALYKMDSIDSGNGTENTNKNDENSSDGNDNAVTGKDNNAESAGGNSDDSAESNPEQQIGGSKHSGPILFLVIVLFVIIAIVMVAFATRCSCNYENGSGGLGGSDGAGGGITDIFERDATMNDIEVDYEINILKLGIDLVVVANVDITNLSLNLDYYDKDDKFITSQQKSIGNIDEGERLTTTISLTDFELSEIFTIYWVRISVAGGTVSLL